MFKCKHTKVGSLNFYTGSLLIGLLSLQLLKLSSKDLIKKTQPFSLRILKGEQKLLNPKNADIKC